MKNLFELMDIVNKAKEVLGGLDDPTFMICMCMLFDEHAAEAKGMTAPEIAKVVYEQVSAVNAELGEYIPD